MESYNQQWARHPRLWPDVPSCTISKGKRGWGHTPQQSVSKSAGQDYGWMQTAFSGFATLQMALEVHTVKCDQVEGGLELLKFVWITWGISRRPAVYERIHFGKHCRHLIPGKDLISNCSTQYTLGLLDETLINPWLMRAKWGTAKSLISLRPLESSLF